jgi:hypothetical protein
MESRLRGRQVVAHLLGELEEFFGHHGTDDVHSEVARPGITCAIAEPTGHRIDGAVVQLAAENVHCHGRIEALSPIGVRNRSLRIVSAGMVY